MHCIFLPVILSFFERAGSVYVVDVMQSTLSMHEIKHFQRLVESAAFQSFFYQLPYAGEML